MIPNPVLKKLGLSNSDRVVIFHADDIGMCQASVEAFSDLFKFGLITSGAVMVPCPWFLMAATLARENSSIDLGVHLTLTSEWKNYRWGPISTRDPASGMVDPQGYFYHLANEAREHGNPDWVAQELDTQIRRAIEAGINPSHIDTHMGTVAHPKFLTIYIQLAEKYRTPAMIARMDQQGYQKIGLDPQTAAMASRLVQDLEESGLPLLDEITGMPLDTPENRLERTVKMISDLKPGITHFIIHPSKDTPELRSITPDWACRAADYQNFLSDELFRQIKQLGIIPLGYQAIKNLLLPAGGK